MGSVCCVLPSINALPISNRHKTNFGIYLHPDIKTIILVASNRKPSAVLAKILSVDSEDLIFGINLNGLQLARNKNLVH